MTALTLAILAAAALLVIWYLVSPAIIAYRRFRGQMVVTCPDSGEDVAAKVDAGKLATLVTNRTWDMQIKSCSRWPEHKTCAQGCLVEIEDNADCLVREQLKACYGDKVCVECNSAFKNIGNYDDEAWFLYDSQPALLDSEGSVVNWHDVDPPGLLELLDSHQPICRSCATVKTLGDRKAEWVEHEVFGRHMYY